MYAIGGSANPTINSQGNRYTAPLNPDSKEVYFIFLFLLFNLYETPSLNWHVMLEMSFLLF